MTTTAGDTPVVVRDVFPARVTVGDRTLTTARAVVTRDRLLVYLNRSGPALDLAYDPERSTVPPYNAPPSTPAHLAIVDGRTATITRQRGCGCGSPVRSWHPWQPYRVAG